MEKKPENCRVDNALEIIVGKWKPIILLHLLQEGTKRHGELKKTCRTLRRKC